MTRARVAAAIATAITMMVLVGCATTISGQPEIGDAGVATGAGTDPAVTQEPVAAPTRENNPPSSAPPAGPSGIPSPIPTSPLPSLSLSAIPPHAPTSVGPPTSAPATSVAAPSTASSPPVPVTSPPPASSTAPPATSTAASTTAPPTPPTTQPSTNTPTVDGSKPPWNQDGLAMFKSPSGNISCMMGQFSGEPAFVECEIAHHTYPQPTRPADCNLAYGDRFVLQGNRAAILGCHGDTVADPRAAILPYGTSIVFGPLTCTSSETGMWCGNLGSGHHFKVASAAYELG